MKNNNLKISISLLLSTIFIVPFSVWAINTVSTGYQTTTTDTEIDAHSTCQNVRHTGSNSYFVPTKTSSEWLAFRNNVPSDVALSDCDWWWYTLPPDLADVFDPTEPFDDYWTVNSCNPSGISVVEVYPWIDTLPTTISANTVYHFNTWDYILTSWAFSWWWLAKYTMYLNSSCTAFVWAWDVNIYISSVPTTYNYASIFYSWFSSSLQNNIFAWINLYLDQDWSWWTHAKASALWFSIKDSTIRDVVISWTENWIWITRNNMTLENIIAYNNSNNAISLQGDFHMVNNIISFNNTTSAIWATFTEWTTINNVLAYNNTRWPKIGLNNSINNAISFNNQYEWIWYSYATTSRFLNNIASYKNSAQWVDMAWGISNNIRLYSNGHSWNLFLRDENLTHYWETLIYDNTNIYTPSLHVQWIDWFLWMSNGSVTNSMTFDASQVVIPSVSWWDFNNQWIQTWTYDENITYTYGSNIPNQSQPIRYNTATNTFELYGVDGVDYDSSKKIWEW